jgi:hypothetical protein
MTTDPNGWFLASQALDHRETVAALTGALPKGLEDEFSYRDADSIYASIAGDLAAELARAGYALVRITPAQHERTEDLSPFLSRKED